MERLTNSAYAKDLKADIERRKAKGYLVNNTDLKYVRLAAYEDIGLEPEEIMALIKEMNEQINIIADMEAAIEKLIAERDSAIKDLKSISEDTGDGCQFCKHLPCMPDPGYCLGWEYKGLKEIVDKLESNL